MRSLAGIGSCFAAAWRRFWHPTGRCRRRRRRRIEVNHQTGLAISGFDPVAYFTDKAPKAGRPESGIDVRWRGLAFPQRGQSRRLCRAPGRLYAALWRLRSGGDCPRRVGARPSVVLGGRSASGFIFSTARTARAAFLADPGRIIERATRKWPRGRAHPRALTINCLPAIAAAGSPQAMKPGTRNFSSHGRKRARCLPAP